LKVKAETFKSKGGNRIYVRKSSLGEEFCFEKIVLPVLDGEALPHAEQLMSSGNAKCWIVHAEGAHFFIKVFQPRGYLDKVRFVRKSRSLRAWEGGMLLLRNGFFAPDLIAQGEIVRRACIVQSFLVTRALMKGNSTYEHFNAFYHKRTREAIQKKRIFIKTMGTVIGRLHRAGICHGDLRPGNIIIVDSGKEMVPYLIDNERNRYFPSGIPRRLREKNLVQINMIVMPQITFADRLRFFKAYIDENPELIPIARDLIRSVFLRTRKRLQKKIPGVWESVR
jgi:serine/threonine protein kinase